jgi:hypothetical protein
MRDEDQREGRGRREHDDLRRARAWCDAAVRRLPAYVPAQGHLAELDAALGETAAAIARLRPLALASDDPDYATQLARILGNAGQTEETQTWRAKAETRYDELLARHPPNSGSRSAAIPSERSGSRGRIFHSARRLVPAPSCAARRLTGRASEGSPPSCAPHLRGFPDAPERTRTSTR